MKKILLSLSIASAISIAPQQAQQAFAQGETYSVAINTAGNVTKLDLGRVQRNEAVCKSLNLAANCTQSQACVAANVAGGASCTTVDANNANVRIYANTLAGREAFVTLTLVKAQLEVFVALQAEKAKEAFMAFCAVANQSQEDGICTAIGQPAGCGICK